MLEKVLFVDDEANVLSASERKFRNHYEVSTALGGGRGLQLIASEGPFAVIVSDMRMPEMNGIQFLRKVRQLAPDSVRLMLTGNADQKTAMDAVNEGSVFRFLTKPCPLETLLQAVEAGIAQHRLISAERELLDGTVNGSIKLLTDILAIVAPETFGRATELREMVRLLAPALQLENTWELEFAAMLSRIALVTIPPATQEKHRAGEPFTKEEQQMMTRLPEIGRNLLANIPRLEYVAEIILYQEKHFDGTGYPDDSIAGEALPVESRILKVLTDLAGLEARGMDRKDALDRMIYKRGWYDPMILQFISRQLAHTEDSSLETVSMEVTLLGLQPGQTLLSNIETLDGKLVYAAGRQITPAILQTLINYSQVTPIQEPFRVCFPRDNPGSREAIA